MKQFKQQNLHKTELSILVGLILALFVSAVTAFAQDCMELRESVLRLHILANSDEPFDQQIKLEVRDQILAQLGEELSDSGGRAGAKRQAEALLGRVESIAHSVVEENGYAYPVNARIVRMYFETRTYGELTMPAGMYDALRIEIGAAQGHNWWCVLYPPVCVPAAADTESIDALKGDTVAGMYPEFEPRFKIVELVESVKEKLRDLRAAELRPGMDSEEILSK